MNILLECGAPAPGATGIPVIDWSSQPQFPLVPVPWWMWNTLPKDFPTPVRTLPPGPKPLSLTSRAVVRALAIHDAAGSLVHHEASTEIRSAALKAAAVGLRRMEAMAALEAELGPLPAVAVETEPDPKTKTGHRTDR
jgi:hypothetical protein